MTFTRPAQRRELAAGEQDNKLLTWLAGEEQEGTFKLLPL